MAFAITQSQTSVGGLHEGEERGEEKELWWERGDDEKRRNGTVGGEERRRKNRMEGVRENNI